MKIIQPKVFLIAEPHIMRGELGEFLKLVGAPEWHTDASSDAEELSELMGRVCYRSFAPGLNPNVTKIREGNAPYLANIIEQEHGSIFEHSQLSFVFANISRVFTHELVRHRVGVGISQESLRYVRLDSLSASIPTIIQETPEAMTIFTRTFEYLEKQQRELSQVFKLDNPETSFHQKKRATSAMRRIAPIGLATCIGWSANFRTLRWVLENRTQPAAEEEMRIVFGQVGEIVTKRYPSIFSDFTVEKVEGFDWYKPAHRKI
ncbi:FAD-dependent thymidylate synthase [candidate division WWE3 bacterium]|uniref:FAD-dependent thymidylate synthase n=1 Tax=candidate division WWE3 bacterium TaxID=2053526 RepID=A0A7X9E7C9_UNCKA|nr:FAD-dependent thymidylate synthase [candidate division WWE3 bacterium]